MKMLLLLFLAFSVVPFNAYAEGGEGPDLNELRARDARIARERKARAEREARAREAQKQSDKLKVIQYKGRSFGIVEYKPGKFNRVALSFINPKNNSCLHAVKRHTKEINQWAEDTKKLKAEAQQWKSDYLKLKAEKRAIIRDHTIEKDRLVAGMSAERNALVANMKAEKGGDISGCKKSLRMTTRSCNAGITERDNAIRKLRAKLGLGSNTLNWYDIVKNPTKDYPSGSTGWGCGGPGCPGRTVAGAGAMQ